MRPAPASQNTAHCPPHATYSGCADRNSTARVRPFRNEQVVVVGHHHERRRHARERVGQLGVVVGVGAVERIADVLDVETLRFLLRHGVRDRVVAAAVGDQDAERQRAGTAYASHRCVNGTRSFSGSRMVRWAEGVTSTWPPLYWLSNIADDFKRLLKSIVNRLSRWQIASEFGRWRGTMRALPVGARSRDYRARRRGHPSRTIACGHSPARVPERWRICRA